MADILEEIVAHKRIEIEQRKRFIQPRQMISLTEQKMKADDGLVPWRQHAQGTDGVLYGYHR